MEKWRPGASVKTNGYELHITFETHNTKRKFGSYGMLQSQRGHVTKPSDFDISSDFSTLPPGLGPEDFKGVDPGQNNPFTCAKIQVDPTSGDLVRKEVYDKNRKLVSDEPMLKSETLSMKTFNLWTKRKKKTEKEVRDRKKHHIDIIIAHLSRHTLNSTNWEQVRKALRFRISNHETMHRYYSRKQWLKMNFDCKRAEDSAMDRCINMLKSDCKVVVMGDASKFGGMKGGCVSAPISKIKRRAAHRARNEGWYILSVDEWGTSKNSWSCVGHRMEKMKTGHKLVTTSNGTRVRSRVHGICRCTNCHTLWNRDVSASGNILYAGIAAYLGLGRPPWLLRNPEVPAGLPVDLYSQWWKRNLEYMMVNAINASGC